MKIHSRVDLFGQAEKKGDDTLIESVGAIVWQNGVNEEGEPILVHPTLPKGYKQITAKQYAAKLKAAAKKEDAAVAAMVAELTED